MQIYCDLLGKICTIYHKYNHLLTTFDHEVHKVFALLVDKGAFFDTALHVGGVGFGES